MKVKLILVGATAFTLLSSIAIADSDKMTRDDRDNKAYSSESRSSINPEYKKEPGDDTVDGPSDQGRNPDGSGDEVSRPYNGGGTNGTRD